MLIYSTKEHFVPTDCPGVLRAQENTERAVTLSNGMITENIRTEAKGMSALFHSGGYRGFASVSGCSENDAKRVLDSARKNFAMLGVSSSAPKRSKDAYSHLPDCTDAPQCRLIEAVKTVDGILTARCPKITGRKVRLHTLSTEKYLQSFSGVTCHSLTPRTNVYITLKIGSISISDSIGGVGFFDDVFESLCAVEMLIDELYADLIEKCAPVITPSGDIPTIMSDCTGILIHEAFGHIAEGDSVVEGSVLKNSIGREVAAPIISASDFAGEAFGKSVPQPQFVDDEGNHCVDAPLIKNGILSSYMTDEATALAIGHPRTGNARAATYADVPVVRMRNTAIHPGSSTLEEMIASTENGIYIKRTGGGQADMTGRFMFAVQTSYRIKDGCIVGALPDLTCTGNSFDTLKAVTMVGSDIKWRHSSLCGKLGQTIPVGMSGPSIKTVTYISGGKQR